MNNIDKTISSGVEYIRSRQCEDGSFSTDISFNVDGTGKIKAIKTTFIVSQIIIALNDVKNCDDIKESALSWLINQKSNDHTYNYWDKHSIETTGRQYPDDMDDTFSAYAVYALNRPSLLDGETLAGAIKALIKTEENPGGPYRTWISDEKIWAGVDTAVNINIAYFLDTQNIKLPPLTQYIEGKIDKKDLESIYYVSIYPTIYFLSRWYEGSLSYRIIDLLHENSVEFLQNPHDAALVGIFLLKYNPSDPLIDEISKYIISTQEINGGWLQHALFIDSHVEKKECYASSNELTTSLCVEFLSTRKNKSKLNIKTKSIQDSAYSEIHHKVKSVNEKNLNESLLKSIDIVKTKEKSMQISSLPFIVNQAFKLDLDMETLIRLSSIGIWGWIAYTIYDDFLDEEGDKLLLPAANYCMRMLVASLHNSDYSNVNFVKHSSSILNKIDEANIWEVKFTRFDISTPIDCSELPNYGSGWQLSNRSIGHAIPAIGVLYESGFGENSKEMITLYKFFETYIKARQISDDMHDWELDLKNGHINYAAVILLKTYSTNKKVKYVDVEKDYEQLRKFFWEEAIDICLDKLKCTIAEARELALAIPSTENSVFLAMLIPLEETADQTAKSKKVTVDFINNL